MPERSVSATEVYKGGYNTSLKKERKGESFLLSMGSYGCTNRYSQLTNAIISIGQYQRFRLGPAMVHKLGHYGYLTAMFDEDIEFYTTCFNFVPSDILYEEADSQIDTLVFMDLDKGKEYVDHHSLLRPRTKSRFSTHRTPSSSSSLFIRGR